MKKMLAIFALVIMLLCTVTVFGQSRNSSPEGKKTTTTVVKSPKTGDIALGGIALAGGVFAVTAAVTARRRDHA